MTNSQFQIVVEMFAQLSKRVEAMHTEFQDTRNELKNDMSRGFAQQEAIMNEHIASIGLAFTDLEAKVDHHTHEVNARLLQLEKHAT